jgi:predicted transposase YdaD
LYRSQIDGTLRAVRVAIYLRLSTDLGTIVFYKRYGQDARQELEEANKQIDLFLQKYTERILNINFDITKLFYFTVKANIFLCFSSYLILFIPSRTVGILDKKNNRLKSQKSYVSGLIITTYKECDLDKIERIFLESSDGDNNTYNLAFQLKDNSTFSLSKMYSNVGIEEKRALAKRLDRFLKMQPPQPSKEEPEWEKANKIPFNY